MYSALKLNGKKLYELAREGKTIERKARRINIFELKLLTPCLAESDKSDELMLEVFCSKGTYIRSLVEDIGQALGCGATVKSLRRLEAGQFSVDHAMTIEQLTAMSEQELFQCLISADKPLEALPSVHLSEEQAIAIKYGQPILVSCTGSTSNAWQGSIRMYQDDVFLGLGEMLLDGKITPKKLFHMNNQ